MIERAIGSGRLRNLTIVALVAVLIGGAYVTSLWAATGERSSGTSHLR